MVAVFASEALRGNQAGLSIGKQFGIQLWAIVITVVYTAVVSFVLLKLADTIVGLRVDRDEEIEGLDINQHGESGYNL